MRATGVEGVSITKRNAAQIIHSMGSKTLRTSSGRSLNLVVFVNNGWLGCDAPIDGCSVEAPNLSEIHERGDDNDRCDTPPKLSMRST